MTIKEYYTFPKAPAAVELHHLFNSYPGATTPGQSGPGSNGNKGVLLIPQSSSSTGTSPSDCLVSYTGHSLGRSYHSAEVQSVYSTAPADWAINIRRFRIKRMD